MNSITAKYPIFSIFNPRIILWMAILVCLIIIGGFGAFTIVTRTHTPAVPWGMLVPSYVFFALAATGSSLVNSFFTVFNVPSFRPIIKKGVLLSIVLVLPALIFIIIDLGKWLQAYNLYILFNPSSRLGWMGYLYVSFLIFLILELIVVIREEYLPKWATQTMGILVLIVTLAVHTNLGALFGSLTAKPLWSSYFLPTHFIASAILVGAMFHIIFITVSYKIKNKEVPEGIKTLFCRDYRLFAIILIFINWWLIAVKFIPGLSSVKTSPYVDLILTGPYSGFFWGLEIAVGGILPLIILILPKTRRSLKLMFSAAILIAIGVYFSKYDYLISGQSIDPFTKEFIRYTPELGDFLLFVGGACVCLLAYTLAKLLLPLEPEEEPGWFIFKKGLRLRNPKKPS